MLGKNEIDELLDCVEKDIDSLNDQFSIGRTVLILEHIADLRASFSIARWWVDDQRIKVQKIIDDHGLITDIVDENEVIVPVRIGLLSNSERRYIVKME